MNGKAVLKCALPLTAVAFERRSSLLGVKGVFNYSALIAVKHAFQRATDDLCSVGDIVRFRPLPQRMVRKVTGLNHLRRHGPLRSYCGNGTQVVNFDLLSDEPIVSSYQWATGGNGSLDLAAHATRVKTQLKFVRGPPRENNGVPTRVLDESDDPVTTSLRVGRVTLHIVDPNRDKTKATAGFLRHLALAAMEDSWEQLFVPRIVQALKEP
ncbi:hypothetical protein V5799_018648 [Amblyomma americanum]|uniref:Uncharacterized protein n=1 Tax=Amblyomma americanum TaxID=6943 RepID=A0AAQ4EYY3_AMBAM